MSEGTTCRWTVDADGVWHASCGDAHEFTAGTPHENKFAFCPYCGRILTESKEVME